MGSKKSIYHSQKKTLAMPLVKTALKSAITTGFPPIRLLLPKYLTPVIGISEGRLSTLTLLFRRS